MDAFSFHSLAIICPTISNLQLMTEKILLNTRLRQANNQAFHKISDFPLFPWGHYVFLCQVVQDLHQQ